MKQINETIKFLEAQINEITGGLPVAVIESIDAENGVIANFKGKHVSVITTDVFEGGEVVPVVEITENGTIEVGKALEFKEAEFVKALIITTNFIVTL